MTQRYKWGGRNFTSWINGVITKYRISLILTISFRKAEFFLEEKLHAIKINGPNIFINYRFQ